MSTWYVQKGNQRLGPMPLEALQSMMATGQLTASDYVWTEGMPNWQPASTQPWFTGQLYAAPALQASPQYFQQGSSFQPGGNFGASQPPGPEPPSLTVWSILVLVLCCLPGGIVGLIYGNKAKTEWSKGNYAAAQSAYGTGKTWLIVSACLGVVITVIYIIAAVANQH